MQLSGEKENEIHVHVSRIPIADVPMDSIPSWCDQRYQAKDALLARFEQLKRFPQEEGEEEEGSSEEGGHEEEEEEEHVLSVQGQGQGQARGSRGSAATRRR